MKLRKPCQHGRYEAHHTVPFFPELDCPGGVFLPDDTLVIELTPEGLREGFTKLIELGIGEFHDCAEYTKHSLVLRASDNARLKCEWVLPDALSVRETE